MDQQKPDGPRTTAPPRFGPRRIVTIGILLAILALVIYLKVTGVV